jgi:hypothetical protein
VPRFLLTAWLLLVCLRPAVSQIVLNPQVGLNASTLSTEPEGVDAGARLGYHYGGYVRLGGRVFLQPGVFVVRVGTELKSKGEINPFDLEEFTEGVDLSAVHVPALLGVDVYRGSGSTLRINGGIAVTFVGDVKDNALGLDDAGVEKVLIGARGGIGVDVGYLTLDLDFERGLTNLFVEEFVPAGDLDIRNDVLKVGIGLKFP